MNEIKHTSDGHNCYDCIHCSEFGYAECINCYNIKTMKYERWQASNKTKSSEDIYVEKEPEKHTFTLNPPMKFDESINVRISRMIDPGKGFGQNFWVYDEITIDESELLKLGDSYFELKNAQIKEHNRRMNEHDD